MDTIPTEISLQIFQYLSVKDIIKLRQVCVRWKDIIDDLCLHDHFWKTRCSIDFNTIYKVAGDKRRAGMRWFDLYRSLSLWPKLGETRMNINEACNVTDVGDEIKGIALISENVIGVHTRSGITYRDNETFTKVRLPSITGDVFKYSENDKVTVLLSYHMFLYVYKKVDPLECPVKEVFGNVVSYMLCDDVLLFIDLKNDLYECNLNRPHIVKEFVIHVITSVVSMGFFRGQLHILLVDKGIYAVKDKKLSTVATLGTPNLMHQLHIFNLLEALDWKTFYYWIIDSKIRIPSGPLEEILTTRVYGDVVFVGCNWGILNIYYKPYTQGQFEIFYTKPMRTFNFIECTSWHCMFPILSIEAQETKEGHRVYVAMPRKIVIINFSFDFQTTHSTATYAPSTSGHTQSIKLTEAMKACKT